MAAHWLGSRATVNAEMVAQTAVSSPDDAIAKDREWLARALLAHLILGLLLAIFIVNRLPQPVEVRAVMPEKGGFLPDALTAEVGVPLELNLISEDVMHGFAVGQTGWSAVDVLPGQMTEVTLTFYEPGTYTYYCTRWCGANHWRMRGTIEVTGDEEIGETAVAPPISPPLYVELGLDIDAPHAVDIQLENPPSAIRGANLDATIPASYLSRDVYLTQPPFEVWQAIRSEPETAVLTDNDGWDLVAAIWQSQTTDEKLQLGQTLYNQNCAACHGNSGAGDGVFGQEFDQATDFTDSQNMLGASTAVFDGKIRRGGMGTGMPYWGAIFTDYEIEAILDYLWTFQFPRLETKD